MRTRSFLRAAAMLALVVAATLTPSRLALAQPTIAIPYENPGTDGDFAPVASVQVDLGLAQSGPTVDWQTVGNGNGVYDPAKWAVVFKYGSVNIPAGVTVTFRNHPSRAPVVWLVDGDVTIAGTVNLNGGNGVLFPNLAEPGPGGFRGGSGYLSGSVRGGSGFGPGGGNRNANGTSHGGGGSYGGQASFGGPVYGNVQILPLIGGSGGAGSDSCAYGGGTGGGAILVAASGSVTVSGSITASGGNGSGDGGGACGDGGGGSGGAIRIIAASLAGAGALRAGAGNDGGSAYSGADGRIRLEVDPAQVSGTVATNSTPFTTPVAPADPPLLWPPDDGAPFVRIVSIGGVAVPEDPAASLQLPNADLVFENIASVQVVLEVRNAPETAAVTLVFQNRQGTRGTRNARFVGGNSVLSMWEVLQAASPESLDIPVGTGFTLFQAKVRTN